MVVVVTKGGRSLSRHKQILSGHLFGKDGHIVWSSVYCPNREQTASIAGVEMSDLVTNVIGASGAVGGNGRNGESVDTSSIDLAHGFVAALTAASSATDFCRIAVHANFTDVSTIGCELVWVDPQAELKAIARYGITHQSGDTSLWGSSLVAQALREQRIIVAAITPPPRQIGI